MTKMGTSRLFLCMGLAFASVPGCKEAPEETGPVRWASTPQKVVDLPQSTQIVSFGLDRGFCALTTKGNVYCWGDVAGFLDLPGNEVDVGASVPVQVPGLEKVRQLSGGGGSENVCVLNEFVEVECFGPDIAWGHPKVVTQDSAPVISLVDDAWPSGYDQVARIPSFLVIRYREAYFAEEKDKRFLGSADLTLTRGVLPHHRGSYAAIVSSGVVVCSGSMRCGRPFDTDEILAAWSQSPTEETVFIEGLPPVKSVGDACAVGTDGLVYCWGANRVGELGTGDSRWFRPPFRPVVGVANASRVVGFADSRCAITKENDLWCWGGILGASGCELSGTTDATGNLLGDEPPRVTHCSEVRPPKKMMSDVQDVAVVGGTVCALTLFGDVHCWGSNAYGKLGIGGEIP